MVRWYFRSIPFQSNPFNVFIHKWQNCCVYCVCERTWAFYSLQLFRIYMHIVCAREPMCKPRIYCVHTIFHFHAFDFNCSMCNTFNNNIKSSSGCKLPMTLSLHCCDDGSSSECQNKIHVQIRSTTSATSNKMKKTHSTTHKIQLTLHTLCKCNTKLRRLFRFIFGTYWKL